LSEAQLARYRIAMTTSPRLRPVRIWLLAIAGLVLMMAVVGAATRLTDSGLSITEWQPLLGAIPPLSETDWQEAFAKYQTIPEYTVVNKGMSLDEFKVIYWWEWGHRFLGRLIGIAFLVPFLVLWWRGLLRGALFWKCLGLFALGALQGAAGWYMVMSGLVERVDVSQYRLALHLAIAVLIFGWALWLALGLMPARTSSSSHGLRLSAAGLTLLIFAQIVLGAFVAGMDAGLAHNTWPLMDGAIVPDGLLVMSPWYANLFENAATVQFDHRMAAYLIAVWGFGHTLAAIGQYRSAAALLAAILVQIGLGIATLLASVPIGLGLAHQAGAFILIGIALWHLWELRGAQPVLARAAFVP
jgi:cytochrome c oxidase assembly protein subunit 15